MNNNTNIRQSQWHITNDAKILSGNQIQFYLYVSWNRRENSCKKRKINNIREKLSLRLEIGPLESRHVISIILTTLYCMTGICTYVQRLYTLHNCLILCQPPSSLHRRFRKYFRSSNHVTTFFFQFFSFHALDLLCDSDFKRLGSNTSNSSKVPHVRRVLTKDGGFLGEGQIWGKKWQGILGAASFELQVLCAETPNINQECYKVRESTKNLNT